jgi:hypothetical protein
MKSKIEIRHEAAKLAVKLPGTTIENFHDRAYRLELYLTGEAVLPETTNEADIINDVFERLKSSQAFEVLSNCNS